jgi:hypothetical protein
MPEQVQPAAPATQDPSNTNDGWAPGWKQNESIPSQGSKPKSFGEAFNAAADDIAVDLGLDTAKGERPPKQETKAEPEDPNGDDELEFAPGKRVKRKELAKRLADSEKLLKEHEELKRGSGKAFREAAEQRKQAESQLQAAQQAMQIKSRLEQLVQGEKDPKALAKKLLAEFGFNPDEVKQQWIEEAYTDSQKSPEQREIDRLRAYEQQVAEFKRQEQQQAQKHQQDEQTRQQQAQTNQFAQNLSKNMMATADKMGLPKTAQTIQRMANMLAGAKERGIDPTWEQLGQAVKQQWAAEVPMLFDSMSYEEFHKLPNKTREKIRSFFLRQAQGPSSNASQEVSAPQPRAAKPQKQMTAQEYNEFVNNLRQPRSA